MVVFGSFGAFWATFGATLQPFYSAYGNYAAEDMVDGSGLNAPPFNNAFGESAIAPAARTSANRSRRLLPSLDGSPLPCLLDLRSANQLGLRHHLLHPGPRFLAPDRWADCL